MELGLTSGVRIDAADGRPRGFDEVVSDDGWGAGSGFRIQRRTERGATKKYGYTWPSKKSLASFFDLRVGTRALAK